MEPRDWFTTAHTPGDFGWFPAPAAEDAAIDQFCEALHKRPHCSHVFAVPLLMTNRWRKTLLKAVDVYFVLKPGCAVWDHSQHEPLGIFVSLPLSRHEPWRLWYTQPVVDLARALREVPDDDFVQKGHILCEFLWRGNWKPCQQAWCGGYYTPLKEDRFPVRFPKDEKGNLLVNEEDKLCFAVARPGYHLFCPFQCELCHFRSIQGRSPNKGLGSLDDTELMKSLRRVKLDAFWSREHMTVSQNLRKVNRALQIAHETGMSSPPMPKLGPWKLEYEFGAGAAAIMARHYMDPGITEDKVQFETVCKMKSAFVNLYQASVENASTAVIGGKDGKKQLVMGVPIYHGWYDRAQTGMHHRMGDKIVQYYGLSRKAAMALQGLLEAEWVASWESAIKILEVAQLACCFFRLRKGAAWRGDYQDRIRWSAEVFC
jgi:hypothetical protein